MAAAPVILGGISLMSTAASAISKVQSASAQSQADNYNAQIAQRNATLALQQAANDETTFRMNSRKQLGAIQAGYAASGVSGGSAEDVLMNSAANAEHDALMIRYGGQLKAEGYREGAQLDRNRAAQDQAGGYLNAAGTLLGGASQAYKDGLFGGSSNYYKPTEDH